MKQGPFPGSCHRPRNWDRTFQKPIEFPAGLLHILLDVAETSLNRTFVYLQ